ncbi:uncharacterized protein VTP21DRAFT_5963 [Calcarisporiella thermophila]|uniref:uncharacterized protein n=1 Tax=Calcarisporiella thermophila TaxID=911321 RepID=UPI0037426D80
MRWCLKPIGQLRHAANQARPLRLQELSKERRATGLQAWIPLPHTRSALHLKPLCSHGLRILNASHGLLRTAASRFESAEQASIRKSQVLL